MRDRAVAPRAAPGTRERKASQCPGWSPPHSPGRGNLPGADLRKAFLWLQHFFSIQSVRPNLGSEFPGADTPWASPYLGHRAWPPRREKPISPKQRPQGRTLTGPDHPCPLPCANFLPHLPPPHCAQAYSP